MKIKRLFLMLLPLLPVAALAQYGDVTSKIELVGNPYKDIYPDFITEMIYARNIWDMQVFNGRIYLGAGNSANSGPAVNAGPLPIISYDPQSGIFREEFVVDDEQIDLFHILDGRLYTPGHDPTQSWNWGNFYRLEEQGWKKYRNVPGGIHNYSMALHDNKMFAALGIREGAAVSVSNDDGKSWVNHELPGMRIYSLFENQNRLFAAGFFVDWDEELLERIPEENRSEWLERYTTGVSEWRSEKFVPRPDLNSERMFPEIMGKERQSSGHFFGKIVKPLNFNGAAVYIGARLYNDHQFMPLGLFQAISLVPDDTDIRRLLPCEEGGKPWDIFERDGYLYVLTARRPNHCEFRVEVFRTADLKSWEPVLHFNSAAFARSFELFEGAFYFGMGSEIENPHAYRTCELHEDTGNILRFDPNRSNTSLVMGDFGHAVELGQHLLSLLEHPDSGMRQAASNILKGFLDCYTPEQPENRHEFLAFLEGVFQDRQGSTSWERQLALRILLMHSQYMGEEKTDTLLRLGIEDPSTKVRSLATLIMATGFETAPGRAMIQRVDGLSDRELQYSAFSDLVNRPSRAFPEKLTAEDFELVESQELPLEGWRFRKDPDAAFGYVKEWFDPGFDDDDWAEVEIGDFWATFLDEMYIGVGWYRLTFDMPEVQDFDAIGLHFGGVDENAWVWVNGEYAGQHNVGMHGWDQPFQLDVTRVVKPGRPNQITVRAKNTRANGGIWRPVEMRAFRKSSQPGN